MKIAIAATPAIAIPAIEALSSKHQIVYIISQPDRPTGRGRIIQPSPVSQWALDHGYELLRPSSLSEIAPRFADVECVITIAYGVLIKKEFLDIPVHGFINLHYSLLPRWRGAAPVQRALMEGDQRTGVSVFQLDPGMDTGPIFTQRVLDIDPVWNAEDLFERLNRLGIDALLEALEAISQGRRPAPQDGSATVAPKITKDEFKLDLTIQASTLINRVRGLFPNAYLLFHDQRVKIHSAIEGPQSEGSHGEVLSISPLTVGAGKGSSLQILRLAPEGKRAMNTDEWLRGTVIKVGDRFV